MVEKKEHCSSLTRIINNSFQYADPTDEPNSAPYDQTFEDYDLQVSEWKGENKALLSILFLSPVSCFSKHVEGDHGVCAECWLWGWGRCYVRLTLTRGQEEPETEIRPGKGKHLGITYYFQNILSECLVC